MEEVRRVSGLFQKDEFITLAPEHTDENFQVQKALLLDASPYFAGALTGGFSEAKTKTLKLPDCDLDTARLFLYYLSARCVPDDSKKNEFVDWSEEKFAFVTEHQKRLIRLWIFGDSILMPKLQNDVIRAVWRSSTYVRAECIEMIYSRTQKDSPLRLLALKSFLSNHANTCGYKRPFYSEGEIERIGVIPGFLKECIDMTAKSVCRSMTCVCSSSCYTIGVKKAAYFVCEQ